MRATLPDFLNAGHDLHFRQSRMKLFGISVMCLAMTVWLAGMGYDWVPNSFSEWWHFKFRFMAPLFALVTIVPFYQLANAHEKGIVLTRTGVTDHRIGAQEIPWLGIDAISQGRNVSSRFIVLRLADARDAPRSFLQDLNGMALGLADYERTISAAGLDVGHKMLVEAVLAAWHAAHHPPHAPDARRAAIPDTKGFGRRSR
jgi:hypothetical protein